MADMKENEEQNTDNDISEEIVDDVTIEMENQEQTLSGVPKKQKDKVQKLQDEKQEYLDGWQRSRAELANLSKVHAEEKKLFTNLGKQTLLEDLIPVLDNFDAAFLNKEAWEQTPETWRIGIEYIHKQFTDALEQNGVIRFGAVGEEFSSDLHESVEMVASEDQKGKVIVLVQSGYKIGDRIIRPAKVKVGE